MLLELVHIQPVSQQSYHILQVKADINYNNAVAPQSRGSCSSLSFRAAIIRSRINTADIGRRNLQSSSIRFKFRLPCPNQGTTAEVNLSSTSLPYLHDPSTSKQACTFVDTKFCATKICICSSIQWLIRNTYLII